MKKREGSRGNKKEIGVIGFEPTASATRTQRSTKLNYTPKMEAGNEWKYTMRVSPLQDNIALTLSSAKQHLTLLSSTLFALFILNYWVLTYTPK
jgi:hypothetical protein